MYQQQVAQAQAQAQYAAMVSSFKSLKAAEARFDSLSALKWTSIKLNLLLFAFKHLRMLLSQNHDIISELKISSKTVINSLSK